MTGGAANKETKYSLNIYSDKIKKIIDSTKGEWWLKHYLLAVY